MQSSALLFCNKQELYLPIKNLGAAQKKKNYIENELKKMRKDFRTETDNSKRKKIRKEIKKLEGSLPALRRYIYENSKNQLREKEAEKRREEWKKKREEVELARLVQQILEQRKNRPVRLTSSSSWNDINDESQVICQSCGMKIRDVYGTSRCGCN